MKYNIGDKIWYAKRRCVRKLAECPDCFGKKYLTVIKGDNSKVTIDCVGCMSGYEPPKGYVEYWHQETDVSLNTIQRIEMDGLKVEYGILDSYRVPEEDLFKTKEEAEERAKVLSEQHNQEEIAKINRKEKHNWTWAWNAHYHRDCIKSAERNLEYHTRKLSVAKVKAKEDQLPNQS